MTNQSVHSLYDAVREALETLRKGPGIPTSKRLDDKRAAAQAIIDLPLVRQVMRSGKSDSAAAHEVIERCISGLEEKASQIVLEVALAVASTQPVDQLILDQPTIGARRESLLGRWAEYLPDQAIPTINQLRHRYEDRAFDQLTRLILSSKARELCGQAPHGTGRVIIVGGVVNDITFRVAEYPEHDMTSEAANCRITPGGKGLMQAVAAARLGIGVKLVAAIGGDPELQSAVDRLAHAGVNIDHVQVHKNRMSSWTGIVELPSSASQAVYYRGTAALTTGDIDDITDDLSACDVVMATFEIPSDVMAHLLGVLANLPTPGPKVIITPSQPYSKRIDRHLLKAADYIVARHWEFLRLFPEGNRNFKGDELYENLLDLDIGHVCLMNSDGPTVYSNTGDIAGRKFSYSPPGVTNFPSSAISRDAFCAALAWHLVGNRGTKLTDAVMWSAAAMVAASATYATKTEALESDATMESLPDLDQISRRASRQHPAQNLPSDG